jgi:hypothetical protein
MVSTVSLYEKKKIEYWKQYPHHHTTQHVLADFALGHVGFSLSSFNAILNHPYSQDTKESEG